MAAVARVPVDESSMSLLQMMENAGRDLAWHVRDIRTRPVGVLAGNGDSGGGGLCAARHLLADCDVPVSVVLDRRPAELDGALLATYRRKDMRLAYGGHP